MTNARKVRERRRAAQALAEGMAYAHPGVATTERRLNAADKPGQHLWIMAAAWSVADPAKADEMSRTKEFDAENAVFLDAENLVSMAGPGCMKCEQVYSAELARRPCVGSVTDLM
jgi:hypothetical protein